MCVSVQDLSGRAACGNCGENVDIAPGAARRWLLGWRRRRRPSRRTRRAAAPCPARAPRRCLPRGPGGTGLGPPRPGWPLPSAPLPAGSPPPDDPPPGARSQTEVRAAAANNVPLWLASETCLLCASRPGVGAGGGGRRGSAGARRASVSPRPGRGAGVWVGRPGGLGLLAPCPVPNLGCSEVEMHNSRPRAAGCPVSSPSCCGAPRLPGCRGRRGGGPGSPACLDF